jgi:N-acetylglucosamine-6-phosphate deacetylase
VLDGVLVRGDVEVAGGIVTAAAIETAKEGRGLAIPGLVDLQVNGYDGVDVLTAEPGELVEMGRALARDGVLWYQPTLVTSAIPDTLGALQSIGQAVELPGAARILGAHLEGPFLSPERPGAHPRALLRRPDLDVAASLLLAGCPVSMVTLAPELEQAVDLIEALGERGIVVSLGHTDATAAVAHGAFDHGARAVTHLYNAMRPFHHREPGVVGAALAREDVVVQLIADGVHVAPEAILTAWRAARGRLVLVSDTISAAGLGDGTFHVGAIGVIVDQGIARTADGALAGSVRPLAWGLRMLVELGVPIVEAVAAVTSAPAELVGRPDAGVLRVGGSADLVVLGDDFAVERVLVGGLPVT